MVRLLGMEIGALLVYTICFLLLSALIGLYILHKRKKMNQMMEKAEAEKYGLETKIELVEGVTRLVTFSRQVESLRGKKYDAWKDRDNAREKNYDVFNLQTEPDVEEEQDSEEEFVEQRNTERKNWDLAFSSKMTKHLKMTGKELFGSGVTRKEVSTEEKGELAKRLQRESAIGGNIQITLAWDDFNDLDLYVITPNKEEISFRKRRSKCGGRLDVDMNLKPLSDAPVENIVWAKDAPEGLYKVMVHFHRHHAYGGTQTIAPFRLRVKTWGEERHYSGTVQHGSALQHVVSFYVER